MSPGVMIQSCPTLCEQALLNVMVKLDRNYNSLADSYDWPLNGIVVKLVRETRKGGSQIAASTSDVFGYAGFTVAAPAGATYHLAVRCPCYTMFVLCSFGWGTLAPGGVWRLVQVHAFESGLAHPAISMNL